MKVRTGIRVSKNRATMADARPLIGLTVPVHSVLERALNLLQLARRKVNRANGAGERAREYMVIGGFGVAFRASGLPPGGEVFAIPTFERVLEWADEATLHVQQ